MKTKLMPKTPNPAPEKKLSNAAYEREMSRLQVELVKCRNGSKPKA